jgi:excisionase family DNA binding protein
MRRYLTRFQRRALIRVEMRNLESDARPLMDIPAVAKLLNVDEVTVRRMIQRGELPVLQLGKHRGAPLRIRPASLDRALGQWETRSRG